MECVCVWESEREEKMEKLPSNLSWTINIYFFPLSFSLPLRVAAFSAVSHPSCVCVSFLNWSNNIRCTSIRWSDDGNTVFILMRIFCNIVPVSFGSLPHWHSLSISRQKCWRFSDFAIVYSLVLQELRNMLISRGKKKTNNNGRAYERRKMSLAETLSTKSVLIFKNYYWQVVYLSVYKKKEACEASQSLSFALCGE